MQSLPTVDAPGVHYNPKSGKKTFIPLGKASPSLLCVIPLDLRCCSSTTHSIHDEFPLLSLVTAENNPEVFTHLATQLGLTPNLSFFDVFSLDPSGTSHIPRPVHAFILICPSHIYKVARTSEYEGQAPYTGSGADEPVLWIRQTIGHACGLMSLLHAVLNIYSPSSSSSSNPEARYDAILPSTPLSRFRTAVTDLDPEARARYLYDDKEIEHLHMAAAQIGDSSVPSAEEDNFNHFITFAKGKDGHLWELNGGMKGPVDRGALEGDVMSERGLDNGIKGFLREGGGEVGFSVVALAGREG